MKIALIAPPYPLEEVPSPPLGLTYIAAACQRAGADVIILDYIVRGFSDEKLISEIDAFGPDIVGTNSVTMNFNRAAQIIKTVKRHFPNIITLMGGPHVSFDTENCLKQFPEIDIIIRGEGEKTLTELLSVVHDHEKWPQVRGIAFKKDADILITGRRPYIQNLDNLPIPARKLLPMARYHALGYPVSIITSRGCPNQCIFCLGRRMVGQKVRFRSTDRVVDEIEELIALGCCFFNIADDLFTASRKRVKAFCNEIIRRKLDVHWSAFSRVNTIDADTLKLMKSAGCHSVSFGIESGNPEMLERVRKGITIAQARKAAKACQDADIRGHASFMVGLPGETHETLADTLRLKNELEIESAYHFLSPFPGTTVRENIAEYDLEILTDDWDLYNANQPIVRTKELSAQEMTAFVHDAEQTIRQKWEALKKRYRNNTADHYEQMQVGGHYRTKMIYTLLSRDVIEQHSGIFADDQTATTALICQICKMTGLDTNFVEFTLKDLMNKKYLKMNRAQGKIQICWAGENTIK